MRCAKERRQRLRRRPTSAPSPKKMAPPAITGSNRVNGPGMDSALAAASLSEIAPCAMQIVDRRH